MADLSKERTEDEIIFDVEISDASLETAALTAGAAAYTQFGLCTVSMCPGDR